MPRCTLTDGSARRRRRSRCALTLVELLVVVAVIAILLSILMPALSTARSRMRTLKCSSNLRTIGFEFQLFAEGHAAAGQGDSQRLGPNRFFIEDFQDSLYGIDEFWNALQDDLAPLTAGSTEVMCPAGPTKLIRRAGYPCSSAAIDPPAGVTLAANMRLYRPAIDFMGQKVLAPAATAHVSTRILQHPYVPLLMDVDGAAAVERGLEPFYLAPPLTTDATGPYATGRYWLPSDRHGGATNVIFVGGHVLSSRQPAEENWDWSYQADVGH